MPLYVKPYYQGFLVQNIAKLPVQDVGRNICHGSDEVQNAEKEIKLWFPDGVTQWKHSQASWVYEKE